MFDCKTSTACSYFMPCCQEGFSYHEIGPGFPIELQGINENHIFFILSGTLSVSFNEFTARLFPAGEMIFLPKSANCRCEALDEVRFVLLSYDIPQQLCDKMAMEQLYPYVDQMTYEFKGLGMCKQLVAFVSQLVTLFHDGVQCAHLHEIKQRELFILLRHYYSTPEKAMFFYHSVGNDMEFKNKVMGNYLKAKTAEELGHLCGYEYRTFLRMFRENFDQTPYQWMQQQTARHIRGSLADKRLSIKEIAVEYGFSSPSHFTTYCKKYFGNTPLKIRSKMQY